MQPTQEIPVGGYLLPSRLDLLPQDGRTARLRTLVGAYNDAQARLEPDFYGYVTVSPSWYADQYRTLGDLASALDGVPRDGFGGEQIGLLRREVDTQIAYVHLLEALPPQAAPKRLHFIWSGGEIRKAALDNIVAWSDRARPAGWQVTIWTDERVQTWPVLTLARLKYNDIQLGPITQATLDARLWPAYDTVTHPAQGRPNFPAGSDLARYSILKRIGGVYLDVDIAPGQLDVDDLARPYRLPLLAPEIRDTLAVRQHLSLDKTDAVTDEHIRTVAADQLRGGYHNNNFVVAPAGSAAIEAVIAQVVVEIDKLGRYGGAASLVGAMADNTAFVTGPVAVKRALVGYLRSIWPRMTDAQVPDLLNQLLTHALLLRWVTAESENQEH